MSTATWLGTSRTLPGQLVPLLTDIDVSRVAGAPPTRKVKAPVSGVAGPITVPDATPMARPALSPLVRGIIVDMLCAGAHEKRTLYTAGTPIGPIAILGYGTGIGGAGGAGVKQISGIPMSIPPACVFANMWLSLPGARVEASRP